nr:MAG TPA: hypothetical protein [Caudoviricetes sp.]
MTDNIIEEVRKLSADNSKEVKSKEYVNEIIHTIKRNAEKGFIKVFIYIPRQYDSCVIEAELIKMGFEVERQSFRLFWLIRFVGLVISW